MRGVSNKHCLLTFFISADFEPVFSKRYKLACVPIDDSDQPAHPRSLIRAFDGLPRVQLLTFVHAEN